MAYKIKSHKSFRKEIKKIPSYHQKNIYKAIVKISKDPTSLPAGVKRLKIKNTYRIWFGRYRLVFSLMHENRLIYIVGAGPSGEVYKIMKRLLD